MVNAFKRFCQAYGAGALGGFIAVLVFLLFYRAGVTEALGVSYYPGVFRTFHVRGPDLALGRQGIFLVWM